ncbi:MAG: hypothetical protein ACI8ZF_000804, partial [Candidatus Midichloriaceae bacterium]
YFYFIFFSNLHKVYYTLNKILDGLVLTVN